jgi:hypothetical protein
LITNSTDLFKIDYVILIGDFNLPEIDWTNYYSSQVKSYEQFLLFINYLGLHQYVSLPTSGNNILDLVLCNNPAIISYISVLRPFRISDYNAVSLGLCVLPTLSASRTFYYEFKNANFETLKQ